MEAEGEKMGRQGDGREPKKVISNKKKRQLEPVVRFED